MPWPPWTSGPRTLLQRTESLAREQLLRLHGLFRAAGRRQEARHDGLGTPRPTAAGARPRRPVRAYRPGDQVRLRPGRRADIFDVALAGRVATVASIEQDFEGRVYLAVTVDDDPGRDLGRCGSRGTASSSRPRRSSRWARERNPMTPRASSSPASATSSSATTPSGSRSPGGWHVATSPTACAWSISASAASTSPTPCSTAPRPSSSWTRPRAAVGPARSTSSNRKRTATGSGRRPAADRGPRPDPRQGTPPGGSARQARRPRPARGLRTGYTGRGRPRHARRVERPVLRAVDDAVALVESLALKMLGIGCDAPPTTRGPPCTSCPSP